MRKKISENFIENIRFVSSEDNIKFLMSQALSRLFLPPFAYALEVWRWSVYNGSIQPYEYNQRYWDIL